LTANPFIYRIITLEHSLWATVRELKKTGIDCIIDLHKNQRTFFIKSFFPFTPTYTFDKLNFKKWLLVQFKINLMPDRHLVDRYFDGIRQLGIHNDGKGLDFFIAEGNGFDITKLPPAFQRGFMVFSIGGNHNTKKMPVEKWILLAAKTHYPVVILAGKEDWHRGEAIAKARANIINLCGTTNIIESASIIRQCRLVVTHDTGLMHIAAAFKKPIVSIWGNTVPALGMYPYYGSYAMPYAKMEVPNLSCRPCSKLGYDRCPEGHFSCMMNQNIELMADWVFSLLQQSE
jgi:heptosyltransferase-2